MEDSGFSGVVRLSNVSDFIAPNLDCIVPLETRVVEKKKEEPQVNIRQKKKQRPVDEEKKSVKISLADCLACNGCITTAETVLVEEQSIGRLLEGIKNFPMAVITVSPQSIVSIAVKLQKTSEEVAIRIARYFKRRGVKYVIDSSFARKFAHSLLSEELESTPSTSRPLLSSACPGLVCYAEKSHGKLLIPRISKIRSPQAICGALVKEFLARREGFEPSDVFHAAVMPCFDKKLEASREQLKIDGTEIRETDCVISTAELLEEISKDEEGNENGEEEKTNGDEWMTSLDRGVIVGEDGGASGGYAERVVKDFVEKNGGVVKIERLNKNMYSMKVESPESGEVVLHVSKVYGFRNIQNLVRKMRMKKEKTDYVEIMACPGGCANGGGQIKYETMGEREKRLEDVENQYEKLPRGMNEWMEEVRKEWEHVDKDYRRLLFTDYKPVETNVSQNLKW
uniref:Fe_hyd_lg_C domain-containing protein n=1 Tax=Caenorhabditis tropicalis TaxID=1561998 RepID=A0A1I7TWN1_9PELO